MLHASHNGLQPMDPSDQKCESGSMVFLPPTRGLSENELAPPFLERSPHAVVGLTKPAPMNSSSHSAALGKGL